MILLDISFIIIILAIGFNIKNLFSNFNDYDRKVLNMLFLFHMSLCVVFYFVINSDGGDATVYWYERSELANMNFQQVLDIFMVKKATGFLLLINYIPAQVLGLSFFSGSIMYGVIGYAAYIFFYAFIKESIPHYQLLRNARVFNLSLFPSLLFLPNLHFWSSGIGKDTLVFFCISVIFYAALAFRKRFLGLLIPIFILIMVRPHILAFVTVALTLGYTFSSKIKLYQKILIVLVFTGLFFLMLDYLLKFVNIESVDTQSLETYSNESIARLGKAKSESAVDMSSYPYPVKIFTFLFRPLFFDSPNILGILSSFENVIMILFSGVMIKSGLLNALKKANYIHKAVFFTFLIGALTFSLILGNMGIMIRQKVPFIMCLIIFGYWTIINENREKIANFIKNKNNE